MKSAKLASLTVSTLKHVVYVVVCVPNNYKCQIIMKKDRHENAKNEKTIVRIKIIIYIKSYKELSAVKRKVSYG